MVVVLDTGSLPVAERVDAVQDAVANTEIPAINRFGAHHGELWHRLSVWDLGAGVHATRVEGTGLSVTRGPKHIRAAAPERVGLGLQLGARGRFSHCGMDAILGVGKLGLTDGTSASDYACRGIGGTKLVIIDYEQLGLRVDIVRAAVTRLEASPLYGLVIAHIAALGEEGDIPAGPAQLMLGSATTQLVRALITTAADARPQRDDLHDTLYLRMTNFAQQHLGDPTLDAEKIARAHHISLRQLYSIWAAQGVSPRQWIMTSRLEGARADLARHGTTVAVSAVARKWGFVNAAHFTRRFRDAFGISPREWQRTHNRP
ncbi:helix-turn-helix transcriptional regulator [Nocardia sp. NPDC004604]|uniref:helix-turn-helix transcriptional regulator n=1 Tax=Nocardia sp. NPDC004604 TaxID=3157013 RepID=UPI0033BA358C